MARNYANVTLNFYQGPTILSTHANVSEPVLKSCKWHSASSFPFTEIINIPLEY